MGRLMNDRSPSSFFFFAINIVFLTAFNKRDAISSYWLFVNPLVSKDF